MSKTEKFFWGGLNTIGGNIIEIRYGNDRVIFDFGLNYNPADVLMASARNRQDKRIADMLKLNMIPKIEGIYEKKDLEMANLDIQSASESDFNTAVFISHLHLDHMGAIDTLSPKIPLYFSEESKELYAELVKIGEGPIKPLNEISTFTYGKPISVGQIKVTGYQIDHDVHGSSALLIETPDKSFCYSGDIRMHGQYPQRNEMWMKEMRAKNVDYLLMEGTTFHPEREDDNLAKRVQLSEQDVPAIVVEKLNKAEGLAFFNFYHRNLDRMKHLIEASAKAGRTIVFEPATAQLVSKFYPNAKIKVLGDVSVSQINENPESYFVQNSFENIFALMDYHTENSVYIQSNGTPLGSFDPAYASMLSFLEVLNIAYESAHVSGHANKEAILDMIEAIKPKTLIPWHSLNPDLVVPLNSKQDILRPELKKWY